MILLSSFIVSIMIFGIIYLLTDKLQKKAEIEEEKIIMEELTKFVRRRLAEMKFIKK